MAFIQGQQGASNSSTSSSTTGTTSVGGSSSKQQQNESHKNQNMDDSSPSLTHATRVSPATVQKYVFSYLNSHPTSLLLRFMDAYKREKYFFLVPFCFSISIIFMLQSEAFSFLSVYYLILCKNKLREFQFIFSLK